MAEVIENLCNEIARQFSNNPKAIQKLFEITDHKTEKSFEDIAKEIKVTDQSSDILKDLAEVIVEAIQDPAPSETKKHIIRKKNITYRNKKILKD